MHSVRSAHTECTQQWRFALVKGFLVSTLSRLSSGQPETATKGLVQPCPKLQTKCLYDMCVCVSGFVRTMLFTTSVVQDYIVHHRPALCTTVLCCARWCTEGTYVCDHLLFITFGQKNYTLGRCRRCVNAQAFSLWKWSPRRHVHYLYSREIYVSVSTVSVRFPTVLKQAKRCRKNLELPMSQKNSVDLLPEEKIIVSTR